MRAPPNRSVGLLALAAIFLMAACDDAQDREPLPDWSDGFDTGDSFVAAGRSGNVVTPDGGTVLVDIDEDSHFHLAINPDTPYPIRLREAGTEDAPCDLAPGGDRTEIDCELDMDELDLWVLGLRYDVVVPPGMCDFLWYDNYKYLNFAAGQGPADISYTQDNDGFITDLLPPSVELVDGKPTCELDHSKDALGFEGALGSSPNCCFGRYRETVTDLETGETRTRSKSWGGNVRDCYYGGAWLDTRREMIGDWPVPRYIHLARDPLYLPLEYEGVSDKYPSNVALANYWDPDDHGGAIPDPLTAPLSNPYYHFRCLDDAEEVLAEIRLLVREFNEELEFDVDGDPDTEGTEADFDSPINDLTDWRDEWPDAGSLPPSYPLRR